MAAPARRLVSPPPAPLPAVPDAPPAPAPPGPPALADTPPLAHSPPARPAQRRLAGRGGNGGAVAERGGRRAGLRWLRLLTHALCAAPFLLLLWDGWRGGLTVNPIQEITLRTGKTALVLLLLSLACTPLNRLLGWRWTVPLRRPLGLWGFFYVTLHMLTFVVVDYGLDAGLIWQAVVEKRYVLAGAGAFLLLLPLALTSTRGWMRRLGRNWTRLHRLIYLALPLAVLHYVWLVKADRREPLLYGAAVLLLLVLRTPPVQRAGRSLRGRVRLLSSLR